MLATPSTARRPPVEAAASASHELHRLIERAARLLPTQGPITSFVHHNTLHAFEDQRFFEAVREGARTYGCQPYLPEDRYREMLFRERIRPGDLAAVLREDLGLAADLPVAGKSTRFEVRLAMLEHPLRRESAAVLRWLMSETNALRQFRSDVPATLRTRMIDETQHWMMRDLQSGGALDDLLAPGRDPHEEEWLPEFQDRFHRTDVERWSHETWEAFCLQLLWRVSQRAVQDVLSVAAPAPPPVRLRDLLLEASGADTDRLVHEQLIPFCAAFVDQGFAHWPLQDRNRGFYESFIELFRQPGGPPDAWLRGLKAELNRLHALEIGPLDSINESLERLGIETSLREACILATLLALRGWAGMLYELENRGERAVRAVPPGTLVGFLAVALILDRLALAHVAREGLGFRRPLCDLRQFLERRLPRRNGADADERAFLVFQLAQVLGWQPADLFRLTRPQWASLIEELEAFPGIDRRRIFHLAFERRYSIQTLDALLAHAPRTSDGSETPRFQVACCLDEREESFRRHLEEVAPEVETFGVAGFYGLPIYYRGAAEAHFVPLCPVIIRPQHYVQEDVVYTFHQAHRRRTYTRRVLGAASHRVHVGSRSFTLGALLAAGFGPLASIPLVSRVLFPRLTARIRKAAGRLVGVPPVTQLQLERAESDPGPDSGQIGFTVDEMAEIVERILRDMGLITRFARLVVVTGHGSSSLNNPHESAHDCGACGGGRGGPNARGFARMANDHRIRIRLAGRGLVIPSTTVFVGAYHNTCDDSLTFFDLDRLPVSHRADFDELRTALDRTRELNAHERCRRFESAPLTLTPEAALRHVQGRAEDLAQTRPEFGHATNAISIVGRRRRTRGLFLDRRAFLTSYDPASDDDERTILERVLQAVIPVCAGISLEYYFSYTDPGGWGCGTKLPHNIAGLVGIMDGAASDLRPGLPWQMVEIHEPMRCLFVIETTPEAMLSILDRNPGMSRLVHNEWVQLTVLEPDRDRIHLFERGSFRPYSPESTELPFVDSSADWYRGWRDHLAYASIRKSQNAAGRVASTTPEGEQR